MLPSRADGRFMAAGLYPLPYHSKQLSQSPATGHSICQAALIFPYRKFLKTLINRS